MELETGKPPPSPLDLTNLQETLPVPARMPYFQAFLNDNPKKAFDSVQLRLKKAKALNQDIATYFQDRAKVEDDYVRGLQRLATKTFVDKSSLGTFANVWDTLFNELHELIKIHSFFITKISEEVEVPLREKATSDPEWSHLKNHESNLGKLAREYEEKLQKVNKHRTKSKSGKKADASEIKFVEAQKALEETKAEWQKSWSTYLEKTQAVDLTRWVNLKETIARFETIQEDVSQKCVEIAEKTLGTVVDFDIQGEIEDFCSKKGLLVEGGPIEESSSSSGTVNQLKSAFSIRRKRVPSQNYSEPGFQPRMESIDSHSDGLRSPSSTSFNNDTSSHSEAAAVPKVVVDSEGYSIPPPEPKWDNFSSSNEENDSDSRSETASSWTQEKMRVEIKPTVAPVNEEEAAAAMSLVMTHLNLAPNSPNSKKSTLRDRKDQWRSTILNTDSIYADTSTSNRANSLLNSSPTSYEFPETANHPRAASDSETQPRGLRASIFETVNIMSKSGEVTKILVTGEIKIQYNFPTIRDHSHPIRIRIKNFETLEKSAPNTSYLRSVPDYVDQFDIDTGLLSLAGGTIVTVMKYQVHIDPESKNTYLPLQVIPHWKCESNLTSLAISYQVNSECKLTGNLSELSFIAPVNGQVGNVQSKPSGVWSMEKQRMYWQVDDINLSLPSERKRILARFETEKASNPAPVAARFLCKGQLLSNISIEIVPSTPNGNGIKGEFESDFKFQEISCQVSSGKFIASP
ncbi:Muniscin C-terminal mu homology domain-containing protein [Glomus cerebriforme]|uniref:Muniscin C-terminal mu homology domain-containing protein n=1 Tax=Glomus cerebriforme TaxID=658196 RepID=A0A397TM69_9GLOM|nr:Muniscin C-terminal mu homology domain-containing protein [Glomus cerebriforme]